MLQFHRLTDNRFLSRSMLTDAMHSMDVFTSRILGSLTCMFPFPISCVSYFATTLKVQPARSHVLSLVPSSSLAKATALRSLGSSLPLLFAYR